MRAASTLVLVALLVLPVAQAQTGSAAPRATLTLAAADDGSETGTLRFDGLRRLTEYQGLCLPERATPGRMYDELGELGYERSVDAGRVVLTFRARGEWAAVELARTPPAAIERPIVALDANFCVPSGGSVRVEVGAPPGATLFFVSDGGRIEGGKGVVEASGPTHVFYSFESGALPDGVLVVEEGPFRVFAPDTRTTEARAIARAAAPAYAAALAEAGLASPFDKVRVLYGRVDSTWEAGHYTGHGYVTVRSASLDPDPTAGYPYTPAKLVVHEAFHAASFPFGRGRVNDSLSWWLEGTARHAERQVDRFLPNASYHCERTATEVRCWDFDDRIRRVDLETAYTDAFTFDARWEPSLPQSDDTRRFYYGWSEYLVGALVAQEGEDAYRDVWDRIEAAFRDGTGCPCESGWLFAQIADETGLARDDLLLPYRELHGRDLAAFNATVKPFVKDEEAEKARLEAMRPTLGEQLGIPSPFALAPTLALALGLALVRPRRR